MIIFPFHSLELGTFKFSRNFTFSNILRFKLDPPLCYDTECTMSEIWKPNGNETRVGVRLGSGDVGGGKMSALGRYGGSGYGLINDFE